MNQHLGLRRAAALLLSLMLAFVGAPVRADEAATDAEHTEKTEKREQAKPSSPETSHEPGDAEHREQTPQPEPDEAQDAEPAPEKQRPHSYGASWSDAAFDGQTVNYTGDLIVGVGTEISIDPSHDIALTRDGKPTGAPSEDEVSFASSNQRYIRVNDSGELHAERKGAAQLQVTVALPDGSQKQLRKSVKIVDQPSIRFAPDSAFVLNGDELDLGQFAKAPLLKASPNVNAQVRYALEPVLVSGNSQVKLNERTGKLSVSYEQPGDIYRVTARAYSGNQASFTLLLGGRADRIELALDPGALDNSGRLLARSGDALRLSALAYSGDQLAALPNVSWSVMSGADIVGVDEEGLLSVASGVLEQREAMLRATSEDGAILTLRVFISPKP